MKYNVDFFISKYEAIPESMWCINNFGDGYGRHCAVGHCDNIELEDLANIFEQLKLTPISAFNCSKVPMVNDARTLEYRQPTPKQRILAALYDIKRMQYPELSTTTINDLFECMPDSATLSRL